MLVVVRDGAQNGREIVDTAEVAAAETPLREVGEPRFNEIQPRAARRREVDVEARMVATVAHPRVLMGGEVVHDQVQIEDPAVSLRSIRAGTTGISMAHRGKHVPMTVPLRMFNAANNVVAILRRR